MGNINVPTSGSSVTISGPLPSGTNTIGNVGVVGSPLNPLTPTSVSVGVSSGPVVTSNSNRKGLILTNTSSSNISFAFGSTAAVLNAGITLTPNGVWEMDSFTFTTQAINAIAGSASSNLGVQEIQ